MGGWVHDGAGSLHHDGNIDIGIGKRGGRDLSSLCRAPTLEFRLKIVKFRPILDQILGEIQTKSDHFLDKFGLYAWNSANFRLLPVFRAPTMSRTLKKLVAVGGGCLVILVFIMRDKKTISKISLGSG